MLYKIVSDYLYLVVNMLLFAIFYDGEGDKFETERLLHQRKKGVFA